VKIESCKNGGSTGQAPKNVSSQKFVIHIKNMNFFGGKEFLFNMGRSRIKILIRRAKTPPNLLGMERKMA